MIITTYIVRKTIIDSTNIYQETSNIEGRKNITQLPMEVFEKHVLCG